MNDDAKTPKDAEGLLRRVAAGERQFQRANLDHAVLIQAQLSGVDLSGASLIHADLIQARLRGANLRDARLSDANLSGAKLRDANLGGADLKGVDLSGADLSGANFKGAHLGSANLTRASLTRANLGSANLSGAHLNGADLSGADLSGVTLRGTSLVGLDLAPLCDSRWTIRHLGPSTVDHTAILRSSRAPGLKEFLVHAGMPEVFVESMLDCARRIGADSFDILRSTFISYGSPDEIFARQLFEALHRSGVTTFFFPEHAVPGEKLHDMVRTKVNELDRILLVCSAVSLDRKGVANEIEETLTREARDGGAAYLIPIILDDYVFTTWKPSRAGTAQAVRDRVAADFRGADTDPAKFQSALLRLIGALKK